MTSKPTILANEVGVVTNSDVSIVDIPTSFTIIYDVII